MKKPDVQTVKRVAGVRPIMMCRILESYPLICEYLFTEEWEDGSPRESSQLVVGMYEGNLRLSLNDRELKQSVYTQCDSLEEGLQLMESALQSEGVRWYKWKSGKKGK